MLGEDSSPAMRQAGDVAQPAEQYLDRSNPVQWLCLDRQAVQRCLEAVQNCWERSKSGKFDRGQSINKVWTAGSPNYKEWTAADRHTKQSLDRQAVQKMLGAVQKW